MDKILQSARERFGLRLFGQAYIVVLVALAICACNSALGAAKAAKPTKPTKPAGIRVVVTNDLTWSRTEGVELDSPFIGEDTAVKVTDASGCVYPAETVGDSLFFTARSVPAKGSKYYLVNRLAKPLTSDIKASGTNIENSFFQVSVDPVLGCITSVYSKILKTQMIAPGEKWACLVLKYFAEDGSEQTVALDGASEVILMESGPARARVSFDKEFESLIVTSEVILYEGVPRLDIKTSLDFDEGEVGPNGFTLNARYALADAEMANKIAFTVSPGTSKAVGRLYESVVSSKSGKEFVSSLSIGSACQSETLLSELSNPLKANSVPSKGK